MDQTAAKLNEEAAAKEARHQSDMSKLREELNQVKLLLSSRLETSVPFTHSPATVQQSTRGSCIVGQSEQLCDLYVEDHDRLLLVAKGTVHYFLGSTVHHQQMSDDEVRVSVEKVIIDAPLPLPTDEMKIMSDVKGTFISWPVKLIHVYTPPQASTPRSQVPSPRRAPSPPPQAQSPTAKLTGHEKITDMVKSGCFKTKSWSVNEVVGDAIPLPVQVDSIDIDSLLLPRQELTDAIIQIWMKFLHQELENEGRLDDFGFLCPQYMSQTTMVQRQEYISRRLCNVRRKVYLLSFFHSRHWQLVIMCMEEIKVIFLCSTHSLLVHTLVQTINDAMRTFQIDALQKRPSNAKEPKWLRPETRRQPHESNLCGQYIMKHMYDIVTKGETKLFAKMFQCPAPLLRC